MMKNVNYYNQTNIKKEMVEAIREGVSCFVEDQLSSMCGIVVYNTTH